jgi:hypothetical protein
MRPISKALRFRILARDGFKCRYCGAKAPDVHLRVDHFIARADGGGNGEENLVTACFDCNAGKSDRKITGLRNPIVNVTNRRGRLTKKTDPRNRALDQVRKGELNHHVLNTGAVIETGRILGDKQFANVWCESDMPGPLKNARHERFAQELAKGMTHVEAYAKRWLFKATTRTRRACLFKNVKVAARIVELKERAPKRSVESSGIDAAWVRRKPPSFTLKHWKKSTFRRQGRARPDRQACRRPGLPRADAAAA